MRDFRLPDAAGAGDLRLPDAVGVGRARRELAPYLAPTPLVRAELLCRALDADVWCKNETVSPVASFKARGALTALLRTRERQDLRGAVTSSTGNHGQGVAWAARLLGVPAHVFLPEQPNPLKRRMIEAFGATVHLAGHDLDAAKTAAQRFAQDGELAFVDDGESLDLMEGAGTVGAEVADQAGHVDSMVVPMGSGTLVVGCAAAIKTARPRSEVMAVQAKGSPAMVDSFRARSPVERPAATVADGLVCRVPAARALAGLWALVDDAVTVDDDLLLAAVHALLLAGHVLTEPAGAAGLAAAWQRRERLAGRTVVLVLSGANIAGPVLRRALAVPPLAA